MRRLYKQCIYHSIPSTNSRTEISITALKVLALGDPKTLTPGPWTHYGPGPWTTLRTGPVCLEDREFHLHTVSPPPFCSAQSPRPRPHEKQHDLSPLSWQPWMTREK